MVAWCYTWQVPTKRPRHLVTETDDLAAALDAAAQRWPTLTRPQLLVRLALAGSHSTGAEQAERRERRIQAIRHHGGVATGAYGDDYLARLRDDWPT
ncbi:MAG: hypothetical protein QOC98_2899 [Frankiaceae bacterium]|nr:hypothetical protein [Frankiaceae bacterium]